MITCKTCCTPVKPDDVICFSCCSIQAPDSSTTTTSTVGMSVEAQDLPIVPPDISDEELYAALIEEQIRTKYSISRAEIFADQPARHCEEDKS